MSKVHTLVILVAIFCGSLAFAPSNSVAQTDFSVNHEIYSWDQDGKARAFIRINLPESFDDVDAATIVRVECGDGTVCYHGLLSVVRRENQGTIGTFSLQLSLGVNVLNMYVSASDGVGGTVIHTVERFRISVPNPRPLEVKFEGYRISGKNSDHTVGATLDFTLRRQDAWPMPAVRVSLQCQTAVSCEHEEVIIPDWVTDQTVTEHRWQTKIDHLPTVPVQFKATFEVQSVGWSGPVRTTVLRAIEVSTDESPDATVNWRVEETDVQGYFMDGTARVGLSLTADPISSGSPVEARVTNVCMFADETRDEVCQALPDLAAVEVGSAGASLAIPGLRLPPGDNVLLIDAGAASDHINVSVEERIVMRRDMWECFTDTSPISSIAAASGGATCSGFTGTRVRKWTLDMVNVYREGDEDYVTMFDDALNVIADITGIEYAIVDDIQSAQVEAYVGHIGNDRVSDQLGEHCMRQHCVHSFSSTNAHDTVDGAIISYLHGGEVRIGEGTRVEESLRSAITYYTKHALLPVGRQIRPYLQGLQDPSTHLRPHDVPMYRLIYSPKAVPGMRFDDLSDLVLFEDETLDYEPSLPPADLVVHKVMIEYFRAGSISVNMIGSDLRNGVNIPGTRLTAQFGDYSVFESRFIKFSTETWSSIIFGFDEESWSSAGGRWTLSDDHTGRGRRYRDELNFDFPLADPTKLIFTELFATYSSQLAVNAQAQYVYIAEIQEINTRWPKPNIEIVIDPETHRMVSYTMEWHFDAEDDVRLPYRVEAEVLEYGAEIEIPDEVRDGSAYLANRE